MQKRAKGKWVRDGIGILLCVSMIISILSAFLIIYFCNNEVNAFAYSSSGAELVSDELITAPNYQTPWIVQRSANARLIEDSSKAYTGENSFFLDALYTYESIGQRVSFKPNTDYIFDFWIKSSWQQGDGDICALIRNVEDTADLGFFGALNVHTQEGQYGDYYHYQVDVRTGDYSDGIVRLGTGAGGCYIDDFKFYEKGADPDKDNLLIDSGFENFTEEFAWTLEGGVEVDYEYSSGVAIPSRSLVMNGNSKASIDVLLTPGTNYILTVWIKNEGVAFTDSVELLIGVGEKEESLTHRVTSAEIDGEYKKIEFSFENESFTKAYAFVSLQGDADIRLSTWSLTATSESTVTTYKLVYDYQAYIEITETDAIVIEGKDFELIVPVREGYTFNGWFTGPNGQGTQLTGADGKSLAPITGYENETTIYASWTDNTSSDPDRPAAGDYSDGEMIIAPDYQTPWIVQKSSNARLIEDSSKAHTGENSFFLDVQYAIESVGQRVSFKPNTVYVFDFWIKSTWNQGDGDVCAIITNLEGNQDLFHSGNRTNHVNEGYGSYYHYQIDVRTGDYTDGIVKILTGMGGFYVDDFKFYEKGKDADKDNLLSDSGFENFTQNPTWLLEGGARIDYTDSGVSIPTRSMIFDGNSKASIGVVLEPGMTYLLTVWVKNDGAAFADSVELLIGVEAQEGIITDKIVSANISEEYAKIEFSFKNENFTTAQVFASLQGDTDVRFSTWSLTCTTVFYRLMYNYQAQTGNTEASVIVLDGEDFELVVPVREGYTFKGWFTQENGQGTQLTGPDGKSLEPITGFEDETVIYAYWTENTTGGNGSTGGNEPVEEKGCNSTIGVSGITGLVAIVVLSGVVMSLIRRRNNHEE